PAPRGAGVSDLPAPVSRGASSGQGTDFDDAFDLALSGGTDDLLAPQGFVDDAPAAAGAQNALDLPAPRGFFDDIPGPASGKGALDLPAPRGSRQPTSVDLPAPRQPSSTAAGEDAPSLDLGGFDLDLPLEPPGGSAAGDDG